MSTPEERESSPSTDAAPSSEPSLATSVVESTSTEAPAPAASAAATPSSPDVAGDDDAEGDDDGAEGGEPAEAGAEGQTAEGGAKKKRRRRRKKKKPEGSAEAGAEGQPTPAEGAAPPAEGGGREKRPKKKEKEERERPPFAVGDVVFGKVLEVTEDVLVIDLSGKAKALFDLRELLIPEEEAAADAKATDDEDDGDHGEPAEAGSAEGHDASAEAEATPEGAGAEAASAEATPEGAAPAETAPAETAPADADAPAADAPAADAEPADAAAPVPAPEPEAEAGLEPKLPRVVLEPGAPFVGVVHNDGGRGGLAVLTHHPKRLRRAKPLVAAAFRDKSLVFGLVTGVIKGGVEVDVDGLRAFAPASHMDLRPGADLHHVVGKRLGFAVTQYGKRGRDVVLSRRAMLEVEAKAAREEALSKLEVGSDIDGTVRSVVAFGAFVDIGGVEGLVPLAEMSWNRGDRPSDVFKVNQKVRVKLLKVDDKGKIWLSRRATVEDPWSKVAERYPVGARLKGKVARLQPFGAFIELEPGVDGLVHTADLSVKRIEHPSEVLKVGEEIDVVVVGLDPSGHRIGLHPAPTGDAEGESIQRVQLHKNLKVVVVAAEQAGLTVRVLGATGRHARGFISASATGTQRGAELRKIFPVGKELDAKVVEMDPRRGDIKLSIRAMNDETERSAYQQYRAQVKREAKFGTLADLLSKVQVDKK